MRPVHPVELLLKEVDIERALCTTLRVRHVIAHHSFLACNLTNL